VSTVNDTVEDPGPPSPTKRVDVDGDRVTMVLDPVMPEVPLTEEVKPPAQAVETPSATDTPKDESDPTIEAAKADDDGNLPVEEEPAVDETATPTEFTGITLESVFEATNSADGLTDEQGLQTIHQIAEAFGGDTERAAEMATQYIRGREAEGTLARLSMISEALPSFDRYGEIMQFAASDEAAKVEYNNAIAAATTRDQALTALRTLNNRYEAHYGSTPAAPVTGDPTPARSVELITSRAQYHQLMADPRYNTSPEYREGLMKRLRASKQAGVFQ
jgi:hypothetical protein